MCDVTLESLATLVDNNLLRRRDGRFTMLETVRRFAAERLEDAGATEVRRRHAEWLTELAEAMVEGTFAGEDATVWLDRIQPEHDNIRAALTWSLENDPELALRLASSLRLFWEVRGHFSEGFRWIEEGLPRRADVAPEVRMRALSASGTIGVPHRARSTCRKSAGRRRSRSRASSTTTSGSPACSATSARRRRCGKSGSPPPSCSTRARISSASSTCRPGWPPCSATSATSPASKETMRARSK